MSARMNLHSWRPAPALRSWMIPELVLLALLFLALSAPAAHAEFGFVPGSADFNFTNQDGTPATQAGSHPFQVNTQFELGSSGAEGFPDGDVKDISAAVPAGLVGSATAVPQCAQQSFSTLSIIGNPFGALYNSARECPEDTQIGVAYVHISDLNLARVSSAIYNLTPPRGLPAEFGFSVDGLLVYLRPRLRSDGDYGFTVASINTAQLLPVFGARIVLWGVPADPGHDGLRGNCLGVFEGEEFGGDEVGHNGSHPPCESTAAPSPFLTLPTSCTGPLTTTISADSWQQPGPYLTDGEPDLSDPRWAKAVVGTHDQHGTPVGLDGCERLTFSPKINAQPTTDRASAPTGLDFGLDVDDPGLTSPGGLTQSQIRKVTATLPQGFTANPSVAAGLGTCSEAQFKSETVESDPGTGCPNDSKIGDVSAESPLLGHPVNGSLFIATQNENPFHTLLALYMVLKDPETGILVKLPGKVEPNETTGQLVTTFGEDPYPLPQLPISHFRLSFRQGQRSPLISPPTCGTFTAQAELTPWSGGPVRHEESSFQITKAFDGGACPSGTPPFHPDVSAGTVNPQAGAYSPFTVDMTRTDGEQEITSFSAKLPAGLSGKLAGVSKCSDAQIAAAEAPDRTGAEELAHPSCPPQSQIGTTEVGAGVGAVLAYAPGSVFLAGPYHGSPISIAAITAAKVGPFDLGTVVVRSALRVNPITAQVSVDAAGSDPIPHIIKGIPVHVRDIQVLIDRNQFTLNPTSCDRTSLATTLTGSGADFANPADDFAATITNPFQVGGCQALGFAPRLTFKLKGKTRRGGLPALTAKVTYPKGSYTNIAKAQVTLPPSEILEQNHLETICTRVQFDAGAGNGAGCPANSLYGFARAVTPLLDKPLEGPVYLRANGGERDLPDLVAALHGEEFNIDLVGFIDSVHKKGSEVSRIRNSFNLVPDAPVSSFTLELKGGKKGLLVNKTNICRGSHNAVAKFIGQNGKTEVIHPALQAQCGGKGKGKRGR